MGSHCERSSLSSVVQLLWRVTVSLTGSAKAACLGSTEGLFIFRENGALCEQWRCDEWKALIREPLHQTLLPVTAARTPLSPWPVTSQEIWGQAWEPPLGPNHWWTWSYGSLSPVINCWETGPSGQLAADRITGDAKGDRCAQDPVLL